MMAGTRTSSGGAPRWLKVPEAAAYARCGPKLIYREIKAKRLRASHIGAGEHPIIRILPEWVDAWLLAGARE
jgi:hypothetical protein